MSEEQSKEQPKFGIKFGAKLCVNTVCHNEDRIDWGKFKIFQEPKGVVIYLPFNVKDRPPTPEVKTGENSNLSIPRDSDFLQSTMIDMIASYVEPRDNAPVCVHPLIPVPGAE